MDFQFDQANSLNAEELLSDAFFGLHRNRQLSKLSKLTC